MTVKLILFVFCLIVFREITALYELTIEKFENAFGTDDKVIAFDGLRVKKYNRTSYVLNGKYDVKIPLDDNIDLLVEAYNMQGGQYKKMADKKVEKFCESIYAETMRKSYEGFFDASSVKIPFGTCPYPAGKHELTNFLLDEGGLLPPYMPGGEKWRFDIRYLTKSEVMGGFNAFVIMRSEQSLMNSG